MVVKINPHITVELSPSRVAKERVCLFRQARIEKITEGSDYKDVTALMSAAVNAVAFRMKREDLVLGMPDGAYCPKAFDAWWDEQFSRSEEEVDS